MWDKRRRWTMWTSSTPCQTTSRFASGPTAVLYLRMLIVLWTAMTEPVILFLAGEKEELGGELDTVDHWHC